jgi:hypothetical protein
MMKMLSMEYWDLICMNSQRTYSKIIVYKWNTSVTTWARLEIS